MRVLLGGLTGALCALVWIAICTIVPTALIVLCTFAGMFMVAMQRPVVRR